MDEPVFAGRLADNIPAIVLARGAGELLFEAGQVQLCVKDAAKGALRHQLLGRAEFGVSQVLNADPGGRAEENNDHAAEPVVVHALHQREDGRDAAHSVQDQGNPARAHAAVEKLVVDVVAVRSEDGLMAQESSADGNAGIEQRDGQRHQRRRHPQHGGGFLAPDNAITAEQKADRQAAAVAQKNGGGVEVIAQETKQRACQGSRRQGQRRIVLGQRGDEHGERCKQSHARRKPVYSVNQVERVRASYQPDQSERHTPPDVRGIAGNVFRWT